MSAPRGEPLGAVAEEARRLVEAVGDWASSRLDSAEQSIATDSAACRICPVCQLIAAVRGEGVDVVARFGEAWSAFLGVLAGHEHSPESSSDQSSSDQSSSDRPSSDRPSSDRPSSDRPSSNTGPGAHQAEPETTVARPVQTIPVD